VRVLRANGVVEEMLTIAAVETQLEVTLLRDGGVIPSILLKTIALHAR
jgi:aconitate hydratase